MVLGSGLASLREGPDGPSRAVGHPSAVMDSPQRMKDHLSSWYEGANPLPSLETLCNLHFS